MSIEIHIRNAIENENNPINAIVMETCRISILAESFGHLPIRAVSAIPIPSPSLTYQVATIPKRAPLELQDNCVFVNISQPGSFELHTCGNLQKSILCRYLQ